MSVCVCTGADLGFFDGRCSGVSIPFIDLFYYLFLYLSNHNLHIFRTIDDLMTFFCLMLLYDTVDIRRICCAQSVPANELCKLHRLETFF